MKIICASCNKTFEGRSHAKTCSARCRKKLQRITQVNSEQASKPKYKVVKINCSSCNKRFEARRDAKTCSDRCRKQLQRFMQSASTLADEVKIEVRRVEKSLETSAEQLLNDQAGFVVLDSDPKAPAPVTSALPPPQPAPVTPRMTQSDQPPATFGLPQTEDYNYAPLQVHTAYDVKPFITDNTADTSSFYRLNPLFSRSRAVVVSVVITLIALVLTTGGTLLVGHFGHGSGTSSKQFPAPQDVSLKDTAPSVLPAVLQGDAEALYVNGDIISNSSFKVTNGSFSSTIKLATINANQEVKLPNSSGTICLDSNNCQLASVVQFNQVQARSGVVSVGGLQGTIGLGNGLTTVGNSLTVDGSVCTTAAVCTGYQAAGNYVNLQANTPGSQQTGNLNISGVGIFGNGISTASLAYKLPTALGSSGQCVTGDGAGQLSFNSCASGSGTAFVQGGNSFGATGVLGTNDANDLNIRTNGTTKLTVLSNGNVGIGTTTPSQQLSLLKDGMSRIWIENYDNAPNNSSEMYFARGRGTNASKTAVVNGDRLLKIQGQGYDGAAGQKAAEIYVVVDGTVASGSVPGALTFLTTAVGSANSTERLRIDSSGNVGIGTSTIGAKLEVDAAASGIGQIIRANATTPGDLLELQNSSGTVLTKITSAGNIDTGAILIEQAFSNITGSNNLNLIASGVSNKIRFWNGATEGARLDELGNFYVGSPGTALTARLSITNAVTTTASLSIKGVASQTADQLQVRDSANTLRFEVGSGTKPATVAGAGTTGGTILTVTGNAGGDTSGSATTAGAGSAVSVTSGVGGTSSGGTNVVGGAGGAITVTSGAGGASTGTAANANGGAITMQGGAAGTGGSGAAGTVGNIFLNPTGGNVAIGTASTPSARLNVVGTTGVIFDVQGTNSRFRLSNYDSAFSVLDPLVIQGLLRFTSNNVRSEGAGVNLQLGTPGISSAALTTTGNLGVGTLTPTALFQVVQPSTGTGTVATAGTTALVGTNTVFTETFRVGDRITVSGETVRTINTITDNTHLTVSVAFSTTASNLAYTVTDAGTVLKVEGNGHVTILPHNGGTGKGGFIDSTTQYGHGDNGGTTFTSNGALNFASGGANIAMISIQGITSLHNDDTNATAGNIIGSRVMTNLARTSTLIKGYTGLTGAVLDVQDASANSRLFVQANGNIGINDNTPTEGNLTIGQITNGDSAIYVRRKTDSSPTGNFFQFQDAASADLATLSITGALTVKTATFNGNITVNGHIISANTSGTTTVAAGAGAGTGASASISGNDVSGTVTITTGTASVGVGALATITFANAYGAAPRVVLTPTTAVGSGIQYYNGATGTTTFTIDAGVSPTISTTYVYNYHVIQ